MLLGWTLSGGLLALFVLVAAPGNSFRMHITRPGLVDLAHKTLLATFQFIFDSFSTLPLPTLVSIVIPVLLFYGFLAASPALSSKKKRMTWIALAAIPLMSFILIAVSFAPSVYGQAFPAERARFIGRLMLTAGLMLEGACLGVLMAQWKIRRASVAVALAMFLLAISAVYPLRADMGCRGE